MHITETTDSDMMAQRLYECHCIAPVRSVAFPFSTDFYGMYEPWLDWTPWSQLWDEPLPDCSYYSIVQLHHLVDCLCSYVHKCACVFVSVWVFLCLCMRGIIIYLICSLLPFKLAHSLGQMGAGSQAIWKDCAQSLGNERSDVRWRHIYNNLHLPAYDTFIKPCNSVFWQLFGIMCAQGCSWHPSWLFSCVCWHVFLSTHTLSCYGQQAWM